jgi:hypothetical protein
MVGSHVQDSVSKSPNFFLVFSQLTI